MFLKLRTKIRNILQDLSKSSFESFTATASKTFTLAQDNVEKITEITVSGTSIMESGDNYSYEENSQTVTIDADSVAVNNIVIIYFNYQKYSDSELDSYILSALTYLDAYSYPINFCASSGNIDIYPTPKQKEQNLISMIASIIIKPDWNSYRTSSVSVNYPNRLSKEEKIEQLISRFKFSREGITGIIELDGSSY